MQRSFELEKEQALEGRHMLRETRARELCQAHTGAEGDAGPPSCARLTRVVRMDGEAPHRVLLFANCRAKPRYILYPQECCCFVFTQVFTQKQNNKASSNSLKILCL